MPGDDDAPVVLAPGLAGRVLGFVSPAILFGIVGLSWSSSGRLSWLAWLLLLLGVVMLASALFDQPRRIELSPDGIHRVCWLRRSLYPWSDVSALTRLPRKRRPTDAVTRVLAGSEHEDDIGKGLMARVGTKRVMLSDRTERLDQWEIMALRVRRWSPGCGLPPKPLGGY